jgi:hypothetical protein
MLLQGRTKQYTTELSKQSASSCPMTFMSIELLDQRLKEFVHLHHLDLMRTINYQLNRFKDIIYDQQLFQQISSYHLTDEQVLTNYLINDSILFLSFIIF